MSEGECKRMQQTMSKIFFATLFMPCILTAELVRINFSVVDDTGRPLPEAVVEYYTEGKILAPYKKAPTQNFTCKTDETGRAVERFECWDGYVHCHLKKDGYYPMDVRDISFGANYDARTGKTSFSTNCQAVAVVLKKVRNPVRMVHHRGWKGDIRLPSNKGVWGFDLEAFDWVLPYGTGRIADFVVQYERVENDDESRTKGCLLFPESYSGAYLKKKDACKSFPIDYMVDSNMTFVARYEFESSYNKRDKTYFDKRIAEKDEYLVVRSRVKVDDQGVVKKANYSHIQGPIGIGRYFTITDCYFNPRENDQNLEYIFDR